MERISRRWRIPAVVLLVVALACAMSITCTAALAAAPGPVTWYMAEGSTAVSFGGPSFETFINLANPGATTATAKLTYMTVAGSVVGPTVVMPPTSSASVDVGATSGAANQFSVSTKVVADAYISAERTLYFDSTLTATTEGWDSITSSIGTTNPAKIWYLAEGSTGSDTRGKFETWVLVQNPQAVDAKVSLTFQTPGGAIAGPQNDVVKAGSRQTYEVAKYVPTQFSVSTQVTSDQNVVAERATYWDPYDTATKTYTRTEGTSSIGASSTAFNWFLPEGSTGVVPGSPSLTINPVAGNFETWILVQNPNLQPTLFSVNFLTPTGLKAGPQNQTLAANSRVSYDVSKYVPNEFSVATQVVAPEIPGSVGVVAERAMYWSNPSIFRQAAAGSVGWSTALQSPNGAGQPTTTWEVPGCQNSSKFEAWILVMADPANTAPASIKITYLTKNGSQITGPTDTLPAGTRKSYRVGDTTTTFGLADLAAVVTCTTAGQQIMVEHSTYFSNQEITGLPTSYRNDAMDTICTNGTMAL